MREMPGHASALRALLRQALQTCDASVLEALGPFATWEALAVLYDGGWLGGGQRSARVAGATIRRRLRGLAAARTTIAAALAHEAGRAVLVEGNILAATAVDLVVADETDAARVPAGDVRWVSRVGVCEGARVTLLGVADSEVDPTRAPDGARVLPRRLVLRAADLPVIAHLGAMEMQPRAR